MGHGGFLLLVCADVEARIEYVAGELDIAALVYGEVFERHDYHAVVHLAREYGVAAEEPEPLKHIVGHGEVAAAFYAYVVAAVFAEEDVEGRGFVDADADIHADFLLGVDGLLDLYRV